MTTIRSPVEWTTDVVGHAILHVGAMARSLRGTPAERAAGRPRVQHIALADLKDALARGVEDFGACRTDVMFLCLIYPLAGVVLIRLAFHYDLLPMIFPMASGLALLGPVVGVLLYEMSRRREQGRRISWADAFGVLSSPSLGAIVVLGLMLLGIFMLWLTAAQAIYVANFGFRPPASPGAFISEVLTTSAGWTMIGAGIGVGFLFALVVLVFSVVSFPLLVDRNVGIGTAIATSFRVCVANPLPIAAWGLLVAAALVIGSLPVFLGLIFVMPVLGHATWHLYRKLVAPRASFD